MFAKNKNKAIGSKMTLNIFVAFEDIFGKTLSVTSCHTW